MAFPKRPSDSAALLEGSDEAEDGPDRSLQTNEEEDTTRVAQ